ncbi:MAG: tRNA dihydrouridine synthase DusB [Rhodospirillaceae bacterium]|nr:tRNA dihydrouridine synthase DusB [Rhodospirillaceae bacterium]
MGIRLGDVILPSKVLLAPMSGVTDRPFRKIVRKHGPSLVFSEMLASREMIHIFQQKTRDVKSISGIGEEEPFAVQLAGWDPQIMATAAKHLVDRGAKIVDLNMGCPAKKVVKRYAGSAIMKDLKLARDILVAVVNAVKVPVTLKMRTGWDDKSRNAPELAKIAEDIGIQMLTIHGRTRCQFYSGKADWRFIARVKETVDIPVIANGDITNAFEAKECLRQSKADGIMIGRGAYGRPWIVSQISLFLDDGFYRPPPKLMAQRDLLLEHVQEILTHYGRELGAKVSRKHICWYTKGLPSSANFRKDIFSKTQPKDLLLGIHQLYSFADMNMAA